jgi:hypothetical protein
MEHGPLIDDLYTFNSNTCLFSMPMLKLSKGIANLEPTW